MAKVRYSLVAKEDLEDIGNYIMGELKNPMAALGTVNRIQDAIEELQFAPRIGAPLSTHFQKEEDYRFLVCGNYLVIYRERADDVFIVRVLYSKRDYIRIIFGLIPEQGE